MRQSASSGTEKIRGYIQKKKIVDPKAEAARHLIKNEAVATDQIDALVLAIENIESQHSILFRDPRRDMEVWSDLNWMHFDHVAGAVSKGLAGLARKASIPVSMGVLTVDTLEQAIMRAGSKHGNKGFDAACAAIETARVFASLSK